MTELDVDSIRTRRNTTKICFEILTDRKFSIKDMNTRVLVSMFT